MVRELGITDAFTPWTKSAQYSPAGLETESPIFAEQPRLPTPLGTLVYTRFARLPLAHRLTALPLLGVVADFDPRRLDDWARYDNMTARELFAAHGVSQRLYKEAFEPMLLVGLFAPGEECSAAAAMGMLLYVWVRVLVLGDRGVRHRQPSRWVGVAGTVQTGAAVAGTVTGTASNRSRHLFLTRSLAYFPPRWPPCTDTLF